MTIPMRRQFQPPDARSVKRLVDLLVEAERRLCEPWDEWDHEVLRHWRDKANDMLDQALRHMPGGQRSDELMTRVHVLEEVLEMRGREVAELRARLGQLGLGLVREAPSPRSSPDWRPPSEVGG
jgi:hypothetical protein